MKSEIIEILIDLESLEKQEQSLVEEISKQAITESVFIQKRDALIKERIALLTKLIDLDAPVLTHEFTGLSESISHYDIDEKLRGAFGREEILPDSESSMFNCSVTETVLERVSSYLKTHFKDLKFNVQKKDPEFWTTNLKFTRENLN